MKVKALLLNILLASVLLGQTTTEIAKEKASKIIKPSFSDFRLIEHLPPVNQDTTLSCWSFSTLSFLESELKRQGIRPIRLAYMFPVYYGFIEKAKHFIATKGQSHFEPGDLFTGVLKTINKYGIVPQDIYPGQTRVCKTFNHTPLYSELKEYMKKIKNEENWNETVVIDNVKRILDKYLGSPPKSFVLDSIEYSPLTFLKKYMKFNIDDYITFTSFKYAPFEQLVSLNVPDNWAKDKVYYNIPLDDFYNTLKESVKKGYSVAIDADTKEPGRVPAEDICFIPDFDINNSNITQLSREFRFENGSTTDEHLMHIVGYAKHKKHDWFLVKDSWRSAWYGKHKGYYFIREDYIKLKILAFIVHKDALN